MVSTYSLGQWPLSYFLRLSWLSPFFPLNGCFYPFSDTLLKLLNRICCGTVSQQNSLSSFNCTGLQAWVTESTIVGASSASQFGIAGTANGSVKDIIIIKAMLSLPKETEKNVQAGWYSFQMKGRNKDGKIIFVLWDTTVIQTEMFFLWNEAQNSCLGI